MSARTIFTSIIVFCALVSAFFVSNIRDVNIPKPVTLPLGKVTQQQFTRPDFYTTNGVFNMTLATLPEDAWCEQENMIVENITLRCYWPSTSSKEGFAANISVPLGRNGDVTYWVFDRTTLQAVPKSHSWLVRNLALTLGAIVFGLFAFWAALLLLNIQRSNRSC